MTPGAALPDVTGKTFGGVARIYVTP